MRLRLVLFVIAASSVASAQERIEFEFEAPVLSRYVWRGLNVVDRPVFQPSLTASRGPWSLNFWGNVQRDEAAGQGNELTEFDTTLSHYQSRGDWDFETGLSRYDYLNTGDAATSELYFSAVLNREWSPSFELYADVEAVDGAYARIGLDRCWCPDETNELNLGFGLGFGSRSHNDYYFASDKAGLVDLGVVLTYTRTVGEASQFAFYGGYSSLVDKSLFAGNGRRDNLVFGAGMTVRF